MLLVNLHETLWEFRQQSPNRQFLLPFILDIVVQLMIFENKLKTQFLINTSL